MSIPNFNVGDYVLYVGENDHRNLTKGSIYKVESRVFPKIFTPVVTEYITYNDEGFLKTFEYYEILKLGGDKKLKHLISLIMNNLEKFLIVNLTFPTEIILPYRVLKQHHNLTATDLIFNGVRVSSCLSEDNFAKMVYYRDNDKNSLVVEYTETFNIDYKE